MITQEEFKLTERWAELEPERCERCKDYKGRDDFDVEIDDDWLHGLMNYPHTMGNVALRIAVEQSIAARKWTWKVDLRRKGDCIGVVRTWINGAHQHTSISHSPTAALLSAYLQALEQDQAAAGTTD